LHDATQDVAQTQLTGWQATTRKPIEVICHGDFAPYNCVFDEGKLVGVIDFDHAHPGPRLWDIAYAIYRFAPTTAPSNMEGFGACADQARRVRLFCEAYGLLDRSQVVTTLIQRVQFMADMLLAGAAQGDARMQANIAAGHLSIYRTDAAYLEENQARFKLALG
jgi:Ser/Thr protein kinase RdoA (MazF antagonist)